MMHPSNQEPVDEAAHEPSFTVNQRADQERPRLVPETDRGPVDRDARATGRSAGMPGTQPAELLADTLPGDGRLPPAVPRVAREIAAGAAAEAAQSSEAAGPTTDQQHVDRPPVMEADPRVAITAHQEGARHWQQTASVQPHPAASRQATKRGLLGRMSALFRRPPDNG